MRPTRTTLSDRDATRAQNPAFYSRFSDGELLYALAGYNFGHLNLEMDFTEDYKRDGVCCFDFAACGNFQVSDLYNFDKTGASEWAKRFLLHMRLRGRCKEQVCVIRSGFR